MQPCQPDLDRLATPDKLHDAFFHLKANKGHAPGPDGIQFDDYGQRDVWDLARMLSKSIRAGRYRPGASRIKHIPKGNGRGTRKLRISNVTDRVVQFVVHKAVTPVWEQIFLRRSYGFRQGRRTWHLLTDLEAAVVQTGRTVLASDDVRNAFDHVDVDSVMNSHRAVLHDVRVMQLVSVILRGGTAGRITGIDQGGSYSPTALNVELHYGLDLLMQDVFNHLPWFRYADDLSYLCRNTIEAQQVINFVDEALHQVGMSLKRDQSPLDLRDGTAATLLGFNIRLRNGRLRFEIHDDAWRELDDHLVEAAQEVYPVRFGKQVACGWLSAYAPAIDRRQVSTCLHMVSEKLRRLDLWEESFAKDLRRHTFDSIQHWELLRRTTVHNVVM